MKKLFFTITLLLIFINAFPQFVIEYPNGELNIEGRLRTAFNKRYYFDGETNSPKNRFFISQARLKFKGTMYKYFDYEMTIETRGYDLGSIAKDLWVGFKPVDEFEVQMGQFKTPFSRQQMISEEKLDVTNQQAITSDFLAGRDIGAMMHFQTKDKKYGLYFGVFTGNGENQKDDDSKGKPLYAGRVELSPLGNIKDEEGDLELTKNPKFTLAGNFTHSDDAVATADYPRTIVGKKFMYGGDFTFVYRGLYFSAEMNHAYLMPDATANYTAGGFLLHSSLFIPKYRLQPVIEYSDYNPSDLTLDDTQRTILFGLNFLPKSNHNIKLMLNYFYHLKMKDSDVNPWARNEIRFVTQLLIK